MGVNPYMIPAQYMPKDTYVSQHVPLPLDYLDSALGERKKEIDALNLQKAKALEAQLLAAPQDAAIRDKLQAEHQAAVEGYAFNLTDTIDNPQEFQKNLKGWETYKRNFARDLNPQTGKRGAVDAAYKSRIAEFARIDAMDLSDERKAKLKMDVDFKYKGIGELTPGGSYATYGSAGDIKHQDLNKQITEQVKNMKPIVEEGFAVDLQTGQRYASPAVKQLMIKAFGDDWNTWYDGWMSGEMDKKYITDAMIANVAKGVLGSKDNQMYLDRITGIDAKTRDEKGNVFVDEKAQQQYKEYEQQRLIELAQNTFRQSETGFKADEQYISAPDYWAKQFGIGKDVEFESQSMIRRVGMSADVQSPSLTPKGQPLDTTPLTSDNVQEFEDNVNNDINADEQEIASLLVNEKGYGSLLPVTGKDENGAPIYNTNMMGSIISKLPEDSDIRIKYEKYKVREAINHQHEIYADDAGMKNISKENAQHIKGNAVEHYLLDGEPIDESFRMRGLYNTLSAPISGELTPEESKKLVKDFSDMIYSSYANDASMLPNKYYGLFRDVDFFNPGESILNAITYLDRLPRTESSNPKRALENHPLYRKLSTKAKEGFLDALDHAEDDTHNDDGEVNAAFHDMNALKSLALKGNAIKQDYNKGKADYYTPRRNQVITSRKTDTFPFYGVDKNGKNVPLFKEGNDLIKQENKRINESNGAGYGKIVLRDVKLPGKNEITKEITLENLKFALQDEMVGDEKAFKNVTYDLQYTPISPSFGTHGWELTIGVTPKEGAYYEATGAVAFEDIEVLSNSVTPATVKRMKNLGELKYLLQSNGLSKETRGLSSETLPERYGLKGSHVRLNHAGQLEVKINGKWLDGAETERKFVQGNF